MKFLNYVGYVFLFMTLVLFSCQSDLEDVVNEENLEFSASRSMGAIDESIVYPKGVIPDWVKNSLSEESLKKIEELSNEFEIRYYDARGIQTYNESKDSSILENFFAKPQFPRIKTYSEIGGGSIGGSGNVDDNDGDDGTNPGGNIGGGGSTSGGSQWIDVASQTNNFYKWKSSMGMVYFDVSSSYLYDWDNEIALEKRSEPKITHDYFMGIYWDVYWQERATVVDIINGGKSLKYHINGRIKGKVVFEGIIGLDFAMDNIYGYYTFDVDPGHNDDIMTK